MGVGMSGFRITGGGSTAGDANVTNYRLDVNQDPTADTAGFVAVASENDAGTVTGTRTMRGLDTSEDYRLRCGVDNLMFEGKFAGTIINTSIWSYPASTMTVTQTSGSININAGNATASGNYAQVRTQRHFPVYGTFGLFGEFVVQYTAQIGTANVQWELGLFLAATTAAPTDGCFFRHTAAGVLECVVCANSVEVTQTITEAFAAATDPSVSFHAIINVTEDAAEFWVNDVKMARIQRPSGAVTMTASNSLPMAARVQNVGVAADACQLRISLANVTIGDANMTRPWTESCCGMGGMGHQTPDGVASAQTALYANSANPTPVAALSNTAAAFTGLGGQFAFNAVAASTTDGIVMAYQVPAGTAALPGKNLVIKGVYVDMINMGAVVATTATVLAMSLAYGNTAVTFATTETGTSKAQRRIALGHASWLIGAAIGDPPKQGKLYMYFDAPIVIQPGEFVSLVAKFLAGTATASQAIWGHLTYDMYWE